MLRGAVQKEMDRGWKDSEGVEEKEDKILTEAKYPIEEKIN